MKTILNVVPSLSNCSESHILAKHSANEVNVSARKDSSANGCSTVSGAAHSPSKPVPTQTYDASMIKWKVFKPSPENVVHDSQPSTSLSVHAKAQEQSFKTILSREFPKGNSLHQEIWEISNCI